MREKPKIFYRSKKKDLCGTLAQKVILFNNFSINISENELIEIQQSFNGKPKPPEWEILVNGTHVYHIENVSKHFKLRIFTTPRGESSHLEYLLDNGIWPIIHRPFEEDGKGHYIVVHDYGNHYFHLYNPIKNCDMLRKEHYHEFEKKWIYPDPKRNPKAKMKERWFMFFYEPGKLIIPFK